MISIQTFLAYAAQRVKINLQCALLLVVVCEKHFFFPKTEYTLQRDTLPSNSVESTDRTSYEVLFYSRQTTTKSRK